MAKTKRKGDRLSNRKQLWAVYEIDEAGYYGVPTLDPYIAEGTKASVVAEEKESGRKVGSSPGNLVIEKINKKEARALDLPIFTFKTKKKKGAKLI